MTGSEKRKLYAERLRQLGTLGLELPLEYGLTNPYSSEVEIEQAALHIECPIVDLVDGRTLYVVWLSVSARRPGIRVYDYRFEPPWPDHSFQQLPDYAESHKGEEYILPDGLSYSREEFLNFRFLNDGWRLPCTSAEGVLCAVSRTPIPDEYGHGAPIPVSVKLFGGSGQLLGAATVVQWADRWEAREARRRSAELDQAKREAVRKRCLRKPRVSVFTDTVIDECEVTDAGDVTFDPRRSDKDLGRSKI